MRTRIVLLAAMHLWMGSHMLCGTPRASAQPYGPWSEWWSDNDRFVLVQNEWIGTLSLREKRADDFRPVWSVPYPDTEGTRPWLKPLTAYITEDGKHVVLHPEWRELPHNRKALIFLGPNGEVLASYYPKQILTGRQMVASVLTPSLAWWWEDGLFFFRCGDTQFAFVTKTGTTHVFDLVTGRAEKLTTDLGRAIHKEAVLLARRQLASPEYDERTRGAIMLGVLRDRDSIPTLKRLLADATAKGTQSSGFGPSYPFYDVQAAAGAALAMLLGREAAPLLEARLRGANPEMAQHWTGLLGEIRAAQPKR